MTKAICCINEKGGVGKTTSAGNIAAALTELGKRVLLIDADPAARLTTWTQATGGATLADVWTGNATAKEAIKHTAFGDVLPGDRQMAFEAIKGDFNLYRLREIIAPLRKNYDYIVIDTAPSLSLLNAAALFAATDVMIVTKPEKFSIDGIGEFYQTFTDAKTENDAKLNITGVVLCDVGGRTNNAIINKKMIEEAAAALNVPLYRVREDTKLGECQTTGQCLYVYAPQSKGAADYMEIAKGIIK
jgi:chromosome partitioning protein